MATRSEIHYFSKGKLKTIYVHYDGYVYGVGTKLFEHYQDSAKIRKLISLGDLSTLGEKVDPSTTEHTFGNPEDGVTVAYGRDRGEEDVSAVERSVNASNTQQVLKYVYEISNEEYSYVYVQNDKTWYYVDLDDGNYMLLSKALEREEPSTSNLKQNKKPRTFITREDSVKVARQLRTQRDKAYAIYKGEDGKVKSGIGNLDNVDIINTLVHFNWGEFAEGLHQRPTQEKLANYIYERANYEVNKYYHENPVG